MGQKVHPVGFRLGTTRTWSSRWFAGKEYANLLHEDVKIRRYIKEALYHAGISRIDVERSASRARISVHTARPGIIIGRKGSEVERLKNELQARTGKEVHLDIQEVVVNALISNGQLNKSTSAGTAWWKQRDSELR